MVSCSHKIGIKWNYIKHHKIISLNPLYYVSFIFSDLYCKWLIQSEYLQSLSLRFLDHNISPLEDGCASDGVVIFSGNTSSAQRYGIIAYRTVREVISSDMSYLMHCWLIKSYKFSAVVIGLLIYIRNIYASHQLKTKNTDRFLDIIFYLYTAVIISSIYIVLFYNN